MAATSHFSVRIYGEIQGNPPYEGDSLSNEHAYTSAQAQVASLVSDNVAVWTCNPAVNMNGVNCYSIVEYQVQGLQQYNRKYAVQQTVATLATAIG